jgi:hypothetical protein
MHENNFRGRLKDEISDRVCDVTDKAGPCDGVVSTAGNQDESCGHHSGERLNAYKSFLHAVPIQLEKRAVTGTTCRR